MTTRAVILACSLLLLTACGPRVEPSLIVLRNSSGHRIERVGASELRSANVGAVRLGSVSPLNAGTDMTFDRLPDAPPLPDRAQVAWEDAAGPREAVVSLAPALKTATGAANEALVLAIMPDGTVSVSVEVVPR